MKTYKKIHESKEVANIHIAKIKANGGEVKQSIQNGKILLEYSFESEYVKNNNSFPTINQLVKINDVDYEMMSFFSRTNKKLEITLKNGDKIMASVGEFYGDLIFHGKFPKSIEHSNYKSQLKEFRSIKVVG